ncbi:NgoMIV family type II restriction endonuclease [Prosthecobacter sp.]|uniref:NgoMIV family type II restriction endonuclease n=1 Tax=Prosthecobacter sp. TaxID=1965333 RepID=UPI002ABB9032|nr:NgoMIV family type II restriction endonuclease [Prosthecobacter sp.]MDZ4403500.1 NgoMIV family type II restriction endonuclease [Prosthecobacter sp.]
MKPTLFSASRSTFHRLLIEQNVLTVDAQGVASNADKDNVDSKAIAEEMLSTMGKPNVGVKIPAQSLGSRFEKQCLAFVQDTFPRLKHLRPGTWVVTTPSGQFKRGITDTEQYAHLATLSEACEKQPELAAILGQDYLIKPDIIILRETEEDVKINAIERLVDESTTNLASLRKANGGKSIFHASISCKFTMRSDRAQNSRSEALNLIRNRKGRTPHIVVVTAEPLPSRLASLALGTGDLDFVYHIALPELLKAVNKRGSADSRELLKIMIEGKRLRDISDLPLDLAV